MRKIVLVLVAILTFSSMNVSAWDRRGHNIVNEVAAYLDSQEKGADFLKHHSFDLGYYANVPDIIWKKPATYDMESKEHFVDLEVLERALGENFSKNDSSIWLTDVTKFVEKYKIDPKSTGLALWRVNDLNERLMDIAKKLKNKKLTKDERHNLQLDWLVTAGVMGHYVADLSQPLHTTENYDGQKSGQKGIHGFFEGEVVDELSFEIITPIYQKAQKEWPQFAKQNKDVNCFELAKRLMIDSNKLVKDLLAIDKKVGRKDMAKVKEAYKEMITDQLVKASLNLALLWKRQLDWNYDGNRFFSFAGEPEYIQPNK